MIPYSLAQSQYSVNFLLRGIPVIYLVAQRWTLVFLLVYKRTFRRKGSVNGDTKKRVTALVLDRNKYHKLAS
ncbi:hypothetical protein RIR_jg1322.t1 [Rhizophagus irregularis DAOM 181602=DAOM 197198]|nr:hypothetical protein RIR_jg1322.t1 [Rhizophagus irregularis DAOM 181602=DAOM 197198]